MICAHNNTQMRIYRINRNKEINYKETKPLFIKGSPLKDMMGVLTPAHKNVILFGNKVIATVIS